MNYPPALMLRKTAAKYLDMSEAAFEREVFAGRLPAPLMIGGRDHWRKDAIDAAIARLDGYDPTDPMEQLKARLSAERGQKAA